MPERDEAIEVRLATVKKFYDAGAALVVDAREPPEYEAGHIPGALSLPFEHVAAEPELLGAVAGETRPIIVYCGDADCDLSHHLATHLVAEGKRRVLVFTAGLAVWEAAGYPVERGPARRGS